MTTTASKFKVLTVSELLDICEVEDARDGVRNIKVNLRAGVLDLGFDETHYAIPLDRIAAPLQLLGWILHLSEKSWINAPRIAAVIQATCAHYGWDPHAMSETGGAHGPA